MATAPGRSARPLQYAAILGVLYCCVIGLYIVLSSALAAGASHSVEELKRIETIKGVVFVGVTGLMVFGASFVALRRMEGDGRELLRRERALVAAEGRVTAGLVASSVAHDASNVLVTVLAEIDELAAVATPAQRPSLDRLRAAVQRLIEINRRLSSASRAGIARELHQLDLGRLAEQAAESIRPHPHLRDCRLTLRLDAGLIARTNPVLVDQILTNLLLNAGEATGGRGRVELRVVRAGDEALLEVHDDGPGVPAERRADVFDALKTTKADGNGLGLFSVKACAGALGGSVEVGVSDFGGALFRVRHPLATG